MVCKDLGRHHLPIMSKNGAHRPALRPEFEHVPPLAELFESGVLHVQLVLFQGCQDPYSPVINVASCVYAV